jgi:hypothetical protein
MGFGRFLGDVLKGVVKEIGKIGIGTVKQAKDDFLDLPLTTSAELVKNFANAFTGVGETLAEAAVGNFNDDIANEIEDLETNHDIFENDGENLDDDELAVTQSSEDLTDLDSESELEEEFLEDEYDTDYETDDDSEDVDSYNDDWSSGNVDDSSWSSDVGDFDE